MEDSIKINPTFLVVAKCFAKHLKNTGLLNISSFTTPYVFPHAQIIAQLNKSLVKKDLVFFGINILILSFLIGMINYSL